MTAWRMVLSTYRGEASLREGIAAVARVTDPDHVLSPGKLVRPRGEVP